MIISFPPRNKRKRRQHWIIIQSKTIKSDFEVVALPNLRNTSGVEMVFWAQPTGAVGPLRRRPRGRVYLFQYRRAAFWVAEDTGVCSHPQSIAADRQSPQPFHSHPRVVPWSHPCIKTSWVWVRRGEHSCSHIICSWLLLLQPIDHCVNKHDMNGTKVFCFAQRDEPSAFTFKRFQVFGIDFKFLFSVSSFHLCSYSWLYHMQTVHFTAEELLTGQFSSWAEIQCSSPSPSGLQEHWCVPNRIHPWLLWTGTEDISSVVRHYWSKQTRQSIYYLKSTQNAEVDRSQ